MKAKSFGVLACFAMSSVAFAAGETPVAVPAELAPIGMLGTLLTDHKSTIVGLIGFALILGLIGSGVKSLLRRFGGGGAHVHNYGKARRPSKASSYRDDDIPF